MRSIGNQQRNIIHIKAGNKGFLPLEKELKKYRRIPIRTEKSARLSQVEDYICPFFLIEAESEEAAEKLFVKLYNALELKEGEPEPMMNILTWYEEGKWSSCIFPRAQHRPSCYFAEGDENILLSPASVDMGGIFITPLEKDFRKIDAEHLEKILSEVCLDREKMYEIIEKLK